MGVEQLTMSDEDKECVKIKVNLKFRDLPADLPLWACSTGNQGLMGKCGSLYFTCCFQSFGNVLLWIFNTRRSRISYLSWRKTSTAVLKAKSFFIPKINDKFVVTFHDLRTNVE